jgi:peptidoglycan hydrolase CwlO-like protein
VIEQLDQEALSSVHQRPKTAKPTSTDVQGLKQMVEQINGQINGKRTQIDKLNGEIQEFYAENKVRKTAGINKSLYKAFWH